MSETEYSLLENSEADYPSEFFSKMLMILNNVGIISPTYYTDLIMFNFLETKQYQSKRILCLGFVHVITIDYVIPNTDKLLFVGEVCLRSQERAVQKIKKIHDFYQLNN